LLIRFNLKNSSVHLSAGFANSIVFSASNFEAFDNAGFHPLTYIMTGQLKTFNSSLSAPFDISPPFDLTCGSSTSSSVAERLDERAL